MIPTANYQSGDVVWHSAAESWADHTENNSNNNNNTSNSSHIGTGRSYSSNHHSSNSDHSTQQLQLFSTGVLNTQHPQQIQQLADWESAMLQLAAAHHSSQQHSNSANNGSASSSLYDQLQQHHHQQHNQHHQHQHDFKLSSAALQAEALSSNGLATKDYEGLLSVSMGGAGAVHSAAVAAAWGSILGSRMGPISSLTTDTTSHDSLLNYSSGAAAGHSSYGGLAAAAVAMTGNSSSVYGNGNGLGLYNNTAEPMAALRTNNLGLSNFDQKRLEDILVKRPELYGNSTAGNAAGALMTHDLSSRFGLNLGGRTYFTADEFMFGRFGKRFRGPDSAASAMMMMQAAPSCQAEGCKADLSLAKHYHRRHKVCEYHSKAATVHIGNQTQRFCQQCSRFHVLSEFDDGKRSCRKRLADHNRRRRKPQPAAPAATTSNANNNNNNNDGSSNLTVDTKPSSPQETTTGSDTGGLSGASKGSPPPSSTDNHEQAADITTTTIKDNNNSMPASSSCSSMAATLSLGACTAATPMQQSTSIATAANNINEDIQSQINNNNTSAAATNTTAANTTAAAAALPWLQAIGAAGTSSSSSSSNGNSQQTNNTTNNIIHQAVSYSNINAAKSSMAATQDYNINNSLADHHLDDQSPTTIAASGYGVLSLMGNFDHHHHHHQHQNHHQRSEFCINSCTTTGNNSTGTATLANFLDSSSSPISSNGRSSSSPMGANNNNSNKFSTILQQQSAASSVVGRASIFGSDISHLI